MQHIQPRYLGKGDLTIEQMKKDFGAGLYSPQYIFLDVKNIPQLLDTKKTKHLQSFFLFIISSDPSTHFISKQLVRLPNNDQKSWSYPDHVDHVKLILLSVAHLILDCCYNDVTTPAAFIFAIWFGYLVRPLREQGVFFLYFQNWGCQLVKKYHKLGITTWILQNVSYFAVFIGIGNPEPKTIPIFEGLTEEQVEQS